MSDPNRAEALRGQKRALSAAISKSLVDLNLLRRAEKRAEDAAARAWNLDLYPEVRRVSLIIYALADYNLEPVVVYLRGQAGKRHWPTRPAVEVGALVDACFLQVDLWELAALTQLEGPTDVGAMRTAVACVEQWHAVVWCRAQNSQKQVAPYSAAVMLEYERARAQLPADIRPSVWLGASGDRKRASRWRARWGGRFVALRPRDIIPVQELREKAQQCSRTALGIWACLSPIVGFGLGGGGVCRDL